jgi:hypothetical protein
MRHMRENQVKNLGLVSGYSDTFFVFSLQPLQANVRCVDLLKLGQDGVRPDPFPATVYHVT